MLEVHERVGAPEPGPQRLARDDVARTLEQRLQNLKGLTAQPDSEPGLPQLTQAEVHLENAKPVTTGGLVVGHSAWEPGTGSFPLALVLQLAGPERAAWRRRQAGHSSA